MDRLRLAVLILRVDAVANAGLAAALVLGAGPIARSLGLVQAWPLLVVAAVLVINAALCWATATGPTPRRLRGLAGLDIVFAVAMLVLAALNPGGAEAGVRWVMAGLGDVVAVVAAVKLWCAREPDPVSSAARLLL